MHIHVCIVTGQPLANLIPILQEKPEQIVLLITPQMRADALQFQTTLELAGWERKALLSFELSEERYDELFIHALEIESNLTQQFPSAQLTYNASGGTKPMALAFFDVFKDHRVIYNDMNHREISVLAPPNHKPIPQASVLTMALALKAERKTLRSANSADPTWQKRVKSRAKFTQSLAQFAAAEPSSLRFINGIAHSALQQGFDQPQSVNVWGKLLNLLSQARSHHLIIWDAESSLLAFTSEDSAKYFGGFWLEEYVYNEAMTLGFEEVACGVDITDDSKRKANIRNDIDLIITHRNQLLFIECKTSKVDKEAEIIYKLDSLATQAGGSFASMLLVTAQPLTYTTREGRVVQAGERAKSHKIRTCESKEILTLKAVLANWKLQGGWS